mmetsp:Transcript_71821/g.201558  ORF Transcript_71821/g.201558 Transcript_71821/m.201558 type:complete len:578 (+) Transcript_71821:675-2408(+)
MVCIGLGRRSHGLDIHLSPRRHHAPDRQVPAAAAHHTHRANRAVGKDGRQIGADVGQLPVRGPAYPLEHRRLGAVRAHDQPLLCVRVVLCGHGFGPGEQLDTQERRPGAYILAVCHCIALEFYPIHAGWHGDTPEQFRGTVVHRRHCVLRNDHLLFLHGQHHREHDRLAEVVERARDAAEDTPRLLHGARHLCGAGHEDLGLLEKEPLRAQEEGVAEGHRRAQDPPAVHLRRLERGAVCADHQAGALLLPLRAPPLPRHPRHLRRRRLRGQADARGAALPRGDVRGDDVLRHHREDALRAPGPEALRGRGEVPLGYGAVFVDEVVLLRHLGGGDVLPGPGHRLEEVAGRDRRAGAGADLRAQLRQRLPGLDAVGGRERGGHLEDGHLAAHGAAQGHRIGGDAGARMRGGGVADLLAALGLEHRAVLAAAAPHTDTDTETQRHREARRLTFTPRRVLSTGAGRSSGGAHFRPRASGSMGVRRVNCMLPVGSLHQRWHGSGPVFGPMLKEKITRNGSLPSPLRRMSEEEAVTVAMWLSQEGKSTRSPERGVCTQDRAKGGLWPRGSPMRNFPADGPTCA